MTRSHLALLIAANLVWGVNFVYAKIGVSHFPPIFYSSLRFVLLFALLFPFLRWARGQMRWIFGICLSMGVIHFTLMFTGFAWADDIGPPAVLVQLSVPFATAIAIVVLGERPDRRQLSGIALSFGGVMVIGFDPVVLDYLDAVVLVVLGALVLAVSTVLVRRMRGISVPNLQAWLALISAPSLLALSLLLEQGQMVALTSAQPLHWGSVAYTAIGSSLVGHGIMYWLLLRYPVSTIMPYGVLTSIFGVFAGWLVLDDQITGRMIGGGLLVLAGVIVITTRRAVKA